jgi:hypothetical protein
MCVHLRLSTQSTVSHYEPESDRVVEVTQLGQIVSIVSRFSSACVVGGLEVAWIDARADSSSGGFVYHNSTDSAHPRHMSPFEIRDIEETHPVYDDCTVVHEQAVAISDLLCAHQAEHEQGLSPATAIVHDMLTWTLPIFDRLPADPSPDFMIFSEVCSVLHNIALHIHTYQDVAKIAQDFGCLLSELCHTADVSAIPAAHTVQRETALAVNARARANPFLDTLAKLIHCKLSDVLATRGIAHADFNHSERNGQRLVYTLSAFGKIAIPTL